MGFNISGLVIDKNYENDIEKIGDILGEKLVFDEKVDFEIGSENWKDDNYCDIYFSEKGTLVFISMERAAFDFNIENQKAFSFVLSEMTMTFAVNYTDNEKMIRSFAETEDGVKHQEKGEKLTFENTESDVSELIHHLIEKTLGKTFWSIDVEEKCFRYKFVPHAPTKIVKTQSQSTSGKIRKAWWKFW